MNDVELEALATLALAEAGAMKIENAFRLRDGFAPAYPDGSVLSLDSMRALDAELRRRGIVKAPAGERPLAGTPDYVRTR